MALMSPVRFGMHPARDQSISKCATFVPADIRYLIINKLFSVDIRCEEIFCCRYRIEEFVAADISGNDELSKFHNF